MAVIVEQTNVRFDESNWMMLIDQQVNIDVKVMYDREEGTLPHQNVLISPKIIDDIVFRLFDRHLESIPSNILDERLLCNILKDLLWSGLISW